jgi:hypothetical protein
LIPAKANILFGRSYSKLGSFGQSSLDEVSLQEKCHFATLALRPLDYNRHNVFIFGFVQEFMRPLVKCRNILLKKAPNTLCFSL